MVQTATYGDFSTRIHERHRGRRAPVEVSIEVTHRCPLACLHCYNNLPMSDAGARRSELSFEEHVRLLDELRPEEAVLGHCKVAGSGGPGNASCRTLFCRTFGS